MRRKEHDMDKTTFLQALQETQAEWEAQLSQLDEARMLQPGVEATWSLKDLLAHLIWYEQEMVTLLQSRVFAGSDLWEVEGDARNELIRQQFLDRPLQEILDLRQHTYRELVEAAQGLSDEDLTDPQHFQGMPEDWIPWQIVAGNAFDHVRDHLSALRRWVAEG
jgi:hypothetical protein